MTRNMFALAILQVANYVIPLFVLIYLTRIFGVEIYGVVAYSVGITQLASVLTDFGFELSAAHKLSVWRNNKKFVAEFSGAVYMLKFCMFMLVAIILILYAVFNVKYEEYKLLFILSLLPIFGYMLQPTWFFMGIEKMRFITLFSLGAKLMYVGLIVFLVEDSNDFIWIPLLNGVSLVCSGAVGIWFIYRLGYVLRVPSRKNTKYALRATLGVFASRLSVSVYMTSAPLLLGLFLSPIAVAIYSLAEQLYKAMQSAFLPVVQALYPYMAKEKNFRLYAKVSLLTFILVVIGSIFGAWVAPFIILNIFGESWNLSIPVLNIFFVAIIVHVVTVLLGYPLAVAVNRIDIANRSVIYGSFLYIAIIPIIGLFDMLSPKTIAIVMIVAELFVLFYRVVKLLPVVVCANKLKNYEEVFDG